MKRHTAGTGAWSAESHTLDASMILNSDWQKLMDAAWIGIISELSGPVCAL